MASSSDTLDTLIVKATNPLVAKPDPVDIASFCDRVTREADGPQIAVKLLAYRIHSPQEKEALNALALLDQCVKTCGPSFHSEIGKFRFLNELIKLVSPKYLAHRTPLPVKQRILDILYTWTLDLKHESKIVEAYDMLKKQCVIKDNPTYLGINNVAAEMPTPKPRTPFFDNAEKDALLQKLLQSKNPEDLQAANRLIKSMVREEENRMEAASRRQLEIQSVTTNIRLLEEFLDNCENNGASAEDLELCEELASNCDKLRPNLSKLAAETDDKGDSLGEILQTSDELSQVLERYDKFMKNPKPLSQASTLQNGDATLDLLSLETLDPIIQPQTTPFSASDDQLLSIDPCQAIAPCVNVLQPKKLSPYANPVLCSQELRAGETSVARPRGLDDLDILGEALLKQNLTPTLKVGSNFQKMADKVPLNELVRMNKVRQEDQSNVTLAALPKPTDSLAASNPTQLSVNLDFDLLVQSTLTSASKASSSVHGNASPAPVGDTIDLLIPVSEQPVNPLVPAAQSSTLDGDVSMLDTGNTSDIPSGINDDVQLLHSPPAEKPATQISARSLAEVFVKFDDIKPSSKPPATLLTQDSGVSVNLHSATAQVPENVSLFVLSATSKSPSPLTNFTFQAIVPKGSRVKLQPPSDNKLPAFNPFLPRPAITQIILLSTPGLNLIELKYVVSFDMDGETITEMGSISDLAIGNR